MSVNIKQYFHKSCQLQSPFAWLIIVYYTLLIKFDRDLFGADRTKLVINNDVISNKSLCFNLSSWICCSHNTFREFSSLQALKQLLASPSPSFIRTIQITTIIQIKQYFHKIAISFLTSCICKISWRQSFNQRRGRSEDGKLTNSPPALDCVLICF